MIITGSRCYTTQELFDAAILESGFEISAVTTCGMIGVDTMAEMYAESRKIPIYRFQTDLEKHGSIRKALYARNLQMLDIADAVIAIWDGKYRNALNFLVCARRSKIPVYVKYVGDVVFADYSHRTAKDIIIPPKKENIHDIGVIYSGKYIGEGMDDLSKLVDDELFDDDFEKDDFFFDSDYESAYNRLKGTKLF